LNFRYLKDMCKENEFCRNQTSLDANSQRFTADYMNYMSDSDCPLCVMSFTNDVADKTKAMLEQINHQTVVLQKLAVVRAQLVNLHAELKIKFLNISQRMAGN